MDLDGLWQPGVDSGRGHGRVGEDGWAAAVGAVTALAPEAEVARDGGQGGHARVDQGFMDKLLDSDIIGRDVRDGGCDGIVTDGVAVPGEVNDQLVRREVTGAEVDVVSVLSCSLSSVLVVCFNNSRHAAIENRLRMLV